MGLLSQEIKELRRMVKLFEGNKITVEHVQTKLKIFNETHKRSRLILDAMIACNKPHLVETRLNEFNVLSKGEFVQLPGDIEEETVLCPDQNDAVITRTQCLNYSGDSENMGKCESCQQFKITRNLLLPDRG